MDGAITCGSKSEFVSHCQPAGQTRHSDYHPMVHCCNARPGAARSCSQEFEAVKKTAQTRTLGVTASSFVSVTFPTPSVWALLVSCIICEFGCPCCSVFCDLKSLNLRTCGSLSNGLVQAFLLEAWTTLNSLKPPRRSLRDFRNGISSSLPAQWLSSSALATFRRKNDLS